MTPPPFARDPSPPPFAMRGSKGPAAPFANAPIPFALRDSKGPASPRALNLSTPPFALRDSKGPASPLAPAAQTTSNCLHLALVLLALVCAACEAPPVFATADKRQNAQLSRIEGHVIVSSAARGNAVIFLFDAAAPPPPLGTGRPLAFTVVPQAQLFANAKPTDLGPFTAPFALSLVAPGHYLLRGFIDANADFVPWYGVTAEVNLGDLGGGFIDPATRATKIIEIPPAPDGGLPAPALDVPVTFSDLARVPVDRPVFEVTQGPTVTLGAAATTLELVSTPLEGPFIAETKPLFLAHLVDANGDGMPDLGTDGRPLFWPKVVVRKITSPTVDETQVDYEHLTAPADGIADQVVLAAGFDFSALLPQLLDVDGHVNKAPTPVTRLSLVIAPQAFDAVSKVQLKTVPHGRYAITVIQETTGQTWRVPNELSPELAAGFGFTSVISQGLVLQVP